MMQNSDTVIDIIELHKNEVELIRNLRNKWKFGQVVIEMRDGIPFRMVRVTEFIDLNQK